MSDIIDDHEKRVLGAALDAPGLWLAQVNRIRPELFGTHRILAELLCEMSAEGKPIDALSVRARGEAGGIALSIADLEKMGDCAPANSAAMKLSVDALHNAAHIRGLRSVAEKIKRQISQPGATADAIIEDAMTELAELSVKHHDGARALPPLVAEMISRLNKPRKHVVKTGLAKFDEKIGGLAPGQLAIIGARPSMGKTALALNIAASAASAGKTVAIFSLEMTAAQITERIISQLSGVNLARITNHRLSDVELQHVTNAAARAHQYNIFICERADQIASVCRQLRYSHGLDLVIVDYIQLMESNASSREQEISKISRGLKALAKSVAAPVVALSQLNRAVEARACKRPMLSDLRESGAIEQDADIVMLLWREAYYSDDADPMGAELIVAKNRSGRTGLLDLTWHKECAQFEQAK